MIPYTVKPAAPLPVMSTARRGHMRDGRVSWAINDNLIDTVIKGEVIRLLLEAATVAVLMKAG